VNQAVSPAEFLAVGTGKRLGLLLNGVCRNFLVGDSILLIGFLGPGRFPGPLSHGTATRQFEGAQASSSALKRD
jgi:hypothetical protein